MIIICILQNSFKNIKVKASKYFCLAIVDFSFFQENSFDASHFRRIDLQKKRGKKEPYETGIF